MRALINYQYGILLFWKAVMLKFHDHVVVEKWKYIQKQEEPSTADSHHKESIRLIYYCWIFYYKDFFSHGN